MLNIYHDLITLTCIGSIGWGILRVERVYQYPFFIGIIFFSFVLPQVTALIQNPGVVSLAALERVLLVTWLCAMACWVGYQFKPNQRWLYKLNLCIDERKLNQAGLVLLGIGYGCNFLLSRIQISLSVAGTWTGPATILYFFSQTIYIAFTIFLLQLLRQPKAANLLYVALASIPPLNAIIFSGRRQATMTFLVVIGLCFYLIRRVIPPRWFFVFVIALITYLIPLIGEIRGNFWALVLQQDWETIRVASQAAFNKLQEGDILELRNAAVLMDAAEQTNRYGYGSGFWDSLIFQYVPGQIVGQDLKEALQFKWSTYNLKDLYGYNTPLGTTLTGMGDSFIEFSYFGCLTFALIGYIFKNLWISSFYLESTISRLLYAGLISPAMLAVTHGIGRFLQESVFQLIFVGLVAYYAKMPYPTEYLDNDFQQDLLDT